MKRATTLAIAVVAAMALTAFIGAASASAATVLCQKAETACADQNVLPAGTHTPVGVSPYGGVKFMVTGSWAGSVKCHTAVVNSTSARKYGNPLTGQAEVGVLPGNCESWFALSGSGKSCESITFNAPKSTYQATGGGAGVIYIGSKSEPLTVSFACWSKAVEQVTECTYKANDAIPVHYDGYKATVKQAEATTSLVAGNEYCQSSGSIIAELESASENRRYISTYTGSVLCSKAETICANGNVLPAGGHTALGKGPGEGKFRINFGGAVNCDYAVINSVSTAEAGNPLLGKSEVGVLPSNCRSSFFGMTTKNCTGLTVNSPGETFEPTGGGQGVIYLGSSSEPLTVSFACYWPVVEAVAECSYKATSSIPIRVGSGSAAIKAAEATLTRVSGNGYCNVSGSLEAELFHVGGGFMSTI